MKIDFSSWALKNQKLLIMLIAILVLGGIVSYCIMPKLEDPEIHVRQSVVVGIYPGASASQVELEVTDPLEKSIRKLASVDFVQSYSYADMSIILVSLHAEVPAGDLQKEWDKMRNRIGETTLPASVQVMVRDDFGDVSGMFYAITGDGMDFNKLEEYAELTKLELQKVDGVGRVDIYGKRPQCISISLNQDKLSSLNINPAEVVAAINGQNANAYSGYFESAGQRIRVNVNDRYRNIEDIKNIILQGQQKDKVRLGDIATVQMRDEKLLREEMLRDGQPALGICIAPQSGADITRIGRRVDRRIQELEATRLPAGVTYEKVFFQPERVSSAMGSFVLNLISSVMLVILLLVFCMNFRSGIILGVTLVVTVISTIFILYQFDGTLQRVSLGSFILAMGMLVDNAIVIVDGIIVDKEAGKSKQEALTSIGRKTSIPLLIATIIAILAFLPIYLSPDVTGLYVRDMFIVLTVSLLLSWVFALVLVPMIAAKWFYRDEQKGADTTSVVPVNDDKSKEQPKQVELNLFSNIPDETTTEQVSDDAEKLSELEEIKQEREREYVGRWYESTRKVLEYVLDHRWQTVVVMVMLLVLSGLGYMLMPQGLFPDMEYDQLYMEYKLPEGSSPSQVKADLEKIRKELQSEDYITHVTTSIGATPCRYNLVRSMALPSLSYGELIIDFKSNKAVRKHVNELQARFSEKYPDAYIKFKRYNLMFMKYAIELGFLGSDPAVLHQLTDSAMAIVRDKELLFPYTTDWSRRVPTLSVDYDQARARNKGITRPEVGFSLMAATDGMPIGNFYDGVALKNIYLNITDAEGKTINDLANATIFGVLPDMGTLVTLDNAMRVASGELPIVNGSTASVNEVGNGLSVVWEDAVIPRFNGQRVQSVMGFPAHAMSNEEARRLLDKEISKIEMPEGYTYEWGGEKMASDMSIRNLFANYPLCILIMIALLIWLFRSYRIPVLLVCCIPFVMVGVIPAMLITGQNFGFVAIVGVLGLVGMMLKNGIVLVDEIKIQMEKSSDKRKALIDSSLSRLRPVSMASLTTILGMTPLLADDMFSSMAAAIIGGLFIGTIIVLIFIPVLYSLLYKMK